MPAFIHSRITLALLAAAFTTIAAAAAYSAGEPGVQADTKPPAAASTAEAAGSTHGAAGSETPAVTDSHAGNCGECGMAGGCGCMQGAEGKARAKAAEASGKPAGCGCKHGQK